MDGVKGVQLENQIRAEVTENVIMHCPQCSNDLSKSFIQPGTLKCSETAARLIYRSTIETNLMVHTMPQKFLRSSMDG